MNRYFILILSSIIFFKAIPSIALEKRSYKIFQFPSNMIPAIDGKTEDWKIIPDGYEIGMDQLGTIAVSMQMPIQAT